jgi:hypothetical protein
VGTQVLGGATPQRCIKGFGSTRALGSDVVELLSHSFLNEKANLFPAAKRRYFKSRRGSAREATGNRPSPERDAHPAGDIRNVLDVLLHGWSFCQLLCFLPAYARLRCETASA